MAYVKSSYCKNHLTLRNTLCEQNSGIFTFEVHGRQWLLKFMVLAYVMICAVQQETN